LDQQEILAKQDLLVLLVVLEQLAQQDQQVPLGPPGQQGQLEALDQLALLVKQEALDPRAPRETQVSPALKVLLEILVHKEILGSPVQLVL
jgi:hypothetical protein